LYLRASDLLVVSLPQAHLQGLEPIRRQTMKMIGCVVALLVAMPVQALAQPPAQDRRQREVRVSYADLNLRSAAGVKQLDRRLAAAVKTVCAQAHGTLDLQSKSDSRQCISVKTAEFGAQRNRIVARESAATFLAGRTDDGWSPGP
jgi:UrcA family protein